MEKGEKNHLSEKISKGGTGTILVMSTGTGTYALFWTSVSILAIPYSFLIRFE